MREKEEKRRTRTRKRGKRRGRRSLLGMDTSLNPCLCRDLYRYLMELCLGLGFSYLLVRNSPTSNNEVD